MAAAVDDAIEELDLRIGQMLRERRAPIPPAPPPPLQSDSRPTTARLSITSGRAVRQLLLLWHVKRLETRLIPLAIALELYVAELREIEQSAEGFVLACEVLAGVRGQDSAHAIAHIRTSMKVRMEKEAVVIRYRETEIERTREEMEETIVEMVILSREDPG